MRYRAEIDGLRAVAVLPVVFFHAGYAGFEGGFLGVDVFFVISGFLITTIVSRKIRSGSFSFLDFYERRARRLMPALFAMMLGVFVAGVLISFPTALAETGEGLMAVPLYVSNILLWRQLDYFSASTELRPLLHTWSLSVEEQFYLLFPAFLMLGIGAFGARVRWLVVLAGTVSMALAWRFLGSDASFFLLPMRVWELAAGAWLSLSPGVVEKLSDRPRLQSGGAALGVVLIGLSMALFDSYTPTPGPSTLIPVGGTLLVLACAGSNNLTGRLLSLRPIVYVGLISYPLYLWHQPLLAFVRQWGAGDVRWWWIAGAIALSFVASHVSYRFVESPFRDRKRVSRRVVLLGTLAGSTVTVAAGFLLSATGGLPQRYDAQVLDILAAAQFEDKQLECQYSVGDSMDTACVLGDTSQPPSMLVWGDSHAGMYAEAMHQQLAEHGMSARLWTMSSCPPVLDVTLVGAGEQCADFNRQAMDSLRRDESIQTVIIAARWPRYLAAVPLPGTPLCSEPDRQPRFIVQGSDEPESFDAFEQRMSDTLSAIVALNKDVIFVMPAPEHGCVVPEFVARRGVQANGRLIDLVTPRDRVDAHAAASRRVLESYPTAAIIDPIPALCTDDECVANRQLEVFYVDDDHLTLAGSRAVLQGDPTWRRLLSGEIRP